MTGPPRSDKTSFKLTEQDLPDYLYLTGVMSEDVPRLLERFLTRMKLHSPEKVTRETLECRAIEYLPLLCRDSAEQIPEEL